MASDGRRLCKSGDIHVTEIVNFNYLIWQWQLVFVVDFMTSSLLVCC